MVSRASTWLLRASLAASAAAMTPRFAPPAVATRRRAAAPLALIMPPDSIAEIVVVEGGVNFLQLYSGVLVFRVLLSCMRHRTALLPEEDPLLCARVLLEYIQSGSNPRL